MTDEPTAPSLSRALLSLKEAANITGIHRDTLYDWCKRRLIRYYTIGGGSNRREIRLRVCDIFVEHRPMQTSADPRHNSRRAILIRSDSEVPISEAAPPEIPPIEDAQPGEMDNSERRAG